MIYIKTTAALVLAALLFAVVPLPARAEPGQAPDLTASSTFTVSSGQSTFKNALDGKFTTSWKASDATPFIEIQADQPIQGLSVVWKQAPEQWEVKVRGEDGAWHYSFIGFKRGFFHDYLPVFGNHTEIRVEITPVAGESVTVCDLSVWGQGDLPATVQDWEKPRANNDLLVISAHPDDEVLYMGGTIPYYAGQRKLNTVVAFMAHGNRLRQTEALNCLWTVGVRNYPVFAGFPDKLTKSLSAAKQAWKEEEVISLLVEISRRYRPKVIVTHDLKGEYGHGAHMLTSASALKTMERSNNSAYYPDSAQKYGLWQPLKCYLHIYPENKISMNWNVPLPAFDGKTALQMAAAGYDQHKSQHVWSFAVRDTGRLSCAEFGLAYSLVEEDTIKKDFFENIYPPEQSVYLGGDH